MDHAKFGTTTLTDGLRGSQQDDTDDMQVDRTKGYGKRGDYNKGKGKKGKNVFDSEGKSKNKGKSFGKSKHDGNYNSKGFGKQQQKGGYFTGKGKGSKGKQADSNVCRYCFKAGHWEKDCYKKQRDHGQKRWKCESGDR